MVGLIMTLAILVLVTSAPLYVPYPQDAGIAAHLSNIFQPPSWSHLFGTDDLGRDVFSRTMMGGAVTLSLSIAVVLIAAAIGVPVGLVAGFKRGKTESVLMRITDAFFAIPTILLALVIAAGAHGGELAIIAAISATWWAFQSRLVRGQVLKVMVEQYIEAAVVTSASRMRILTKHVLPNVFPLVLVQSTIQFGLSILLVGALGFLGLGLNAPSPEWGLAISVGKQYIPVFWWISVFPGVIMFVAVLGVSLLGDGLRDILDPRLRI